LAILHLNHSLRTKFAYDFAMRNAPSLIALIAVSLATSADCAPLGRQSSIAGDYGRPGTRTAVEGARRLNLVCVGSGKSTVVFLSGLGGGTFDWRKVQPVVGRFIRACAYDRAGYGFSDPATAPSDVINTVSDLHALLHSKAIAAPVILVGHSLGGLYATSYALRYPRDVAGLVLVEPAFNGQAAQIAKAIGPAAAGRLEAANKQTVTALDRCVALAASGRLSLPVEQSSDCLDNPADPDPDVHRERNREAKSVAFQRTLRSEYEMANITDAGGETRDDHQSEWAGSTLGSMPLVVLTRGNSEALPGLSAGEVANAERAWRMGHDRLAELSTVGTHVIVPHSGHFVQLEQPEVVIREVLKIERDIRRCPVGSRPP